MGDEQIDKPVKLCRACGKPTSNSSNICDDCTHKFELETSKILQSEDAKFLRHCKYCGRPIVSYSVVNYKNKGPTKRIGKKMFCDLHYSQCKICGKPIPFKGDTSFIPSACSKECRKQLQTDSYRKTCQERYGVDAIMQSPEMVKRYKENSLEKYGVDNPFKVLEIQAKKDATCLERYGTIHPSQCKEIKEKTMKTCLDKYGVPYAGHTAESESKRTATLIEIYGVDNAGKSPEVQERMKQTCRDRYGVDYAITSTEVRSKIQETLLERYGAPSPFVDPDVRDKRDKTWEARYGGHPMKCHKVSEKSKATSEERYGGLGFASPELSAKMRQTCLERYGAENVNSLEEFQDKKRETFKRNYGVEHPMKCEAVADKVRQSRIMNHASSIHDPIKRQNYIDFCDNPRDYILSNFNHKPSLIEISETLGNLDPTSVSERLSPDDHNLLGNSISTMERSVIEFLYTIVSEDDIILHDRHAIHPYELDIFIPRYNVAIECNPSATHNSSIQCFCRDEKPLSKNYHKRKSKMCEDRGIFLFHIFGYEWINRRNVVQSMIANVLHSCKTKIYSRKLHVANIEHIDAEQFLIDNHLQGSLYSNVRLGLVDDKGDIQSLMTFNRMRHTIGRSKDYTENTWELSRFCNKRNSTVIGAASKLFKHFQREYGPETVVSFSDIAHTRGNLYSILGFEKSSITEPGYVWADMDDNIYYNRVTCQKNNLRRLFKDDTIDIDNQTEDMIMVSHGFVKVYDSGKIKWIWRDKHAK